MRTGFVLTAVGVALALGIAAAASDGRLLTRALVLGVIPGSWALSRGLERFAGRDLWHFTAPHADRANTVRPMTPRVAT